MGHRLVPAALVLAGLVGTLSAPCPAAELLELYRQALAGAPELRATIHERTAASEGSRQAFAGFLPSVQFSYDGTATTQDVNDAEEDIFTEGSDRFYTSDWSLTLRQPLFRLDNHRAFDQARNRERGATAALEQARQTLGLRLAEIYFDALAAADQLAFTRSELVAVEEEARRETARREAGLGRRTDAAEASARRSTLAARQIRDWRRIDDAHRALAELTGRPVADLAPLRADLPLVRPNPDDPDAWATMAATANLDVVLRHHELEVARDEVERQRSEHYPTVDLLARLNRNDAGGSVFGGGRELDTAEVGIRINVPLYSGGLVSARVREATALMSSAMERVDIARRAAHRAGHDSYAGVLSALAQIEALTESVAAQRLLRDERRIGYERGMLTVLAVLDAERDLTEAARDLSLARYEYVIESLRLKHAAGILDAAAIEATNDLLDSSASR
ncbi:MAG: TolC family outer membrane protein [Gammaproteobacteria bacterium]